jgi:hypothetical protein
VKPAAKFRPVWNYTVSFLARYRNTAIALTTGAAVVLAAVRYWRLLIRAIPAQLSSLARAILAFVQAHPHLSHAFHVFVNMVPDIAYLLLAIAGLSYLMPKVVKKIESSGLLRVIVITLFACFGLLAIIVNAVNRTDQEERESQLKGKIDKQGDKIDVVRDSIGRVLTFLVNSKGTLNEVERRKQVLESLRDQYVIDHPDVPVTMITGNAWPPKPWMDKRLQELGEKFQFILPLSSQANAPTLPCTPGRPRINAGPDGYKGVCDEDLGQWAIEEAKKIAGPADKCVRNQMTIAQNKDKKDNFTVKQDIEFVSLHFRQWFDAEESTVKQLRNEVVARLGPVAKNPEEQWRWERVFPEERQMPPNTPPEIKERILRSLMHDVYCGDVQEYALYLFHLAFKLKRRVVPLKPSRLLKFTETQVPPPNGAPGLNLTCSAVVTISTTVPLPEGYIVVEFDNGYTTSVDDFISNPFIVGFDTPDNVELADYLALKTPSQMVAREIFTIPFVPKKPIHVQVSGAQELHVNKVMWFDE